MRKLIIRIQEFFQTQKTAEQATVSLGELQQWSDLQYKPLLKNTYELMRKQLIACKDARKDLSLAIKEIEEFSVRNQRVDVQTKILNKRHLLLKNIKELQVLLNGVDELEDLFKIYGFFKKLQKLNQDIILVREEVGEILQEYMARPYAQVVQILHTLDQIFKQSRAILTQPVNKNYLKVQKLAQEIVEKSEKSLYYEEKMEITKNHVVDRREQVNQLQVKIAAIKNDSRYKMEKESIKNRAGKFSLSFYDLELDKLEKQVAELAQTIVALKEHYHKLKEAKDELNIEGCEESFKQYILSDFLIEVEIVSHKNQ